MRKYGYKIIEIDKQYANSAMNEILINSLFYLKADICQDEKLKIMIYAKHEDKYKKIFQEKNIAANFSESTGFFSRISRYFKRYGFIFGAFFLLICVYFSSLFIWRIDIEGNYSVSDEEILELLEQSGVSLGTFIPKIDYDTVHNKFLMSSENIAWISVNITGNVANVVVREKLPDKETPKNTYTNVIAKYDAQIYQIKLINGKKVINNGDVIKKGDLLVSGIINSQSEGVRYTHADAEILGYVNKQIDIKIPFKSEQKVYNNKEYTEKSFKIFSKLINFSPKYRNQGLFYDTIETKDRVCLFGIIELPIEIISKTYKEYEVTEIENSYEKIIDLAFLKLREEMDINLENSELISKKLETSWDDEYFYISCNLYCLENIAELVEFQVN